MHTYLVIFYVKVSGNKLGMRQLDNVVANSAKHAERLASEWPEFDSIHEVIQTN